MDFDLLGELTKAERQIRKAREAINNEAEGDLKDALELLEQSAVRMTEFVARW